jgi:hypothetical protein
MTVRRRLCFGGRAARTADGGRRKPQFNIGCHETETIEMGGAGGVGAVNRRRSGAVTKPREWFALLLNQLATIKKPAGSGLFLKADAADDGVWTSRTRAVRRRRSLNAVRR